jgi:CRP/FNR family transcriptional regulator, cyclic AMP receptor protein
VINARGATLREQREVRAPRRRTGGGLGVNKVSTIARPTESLAQVPLFASLEGGCVRALDGRCHWRRLKAGDWLNASAEHTTDVFFVINGHLRIFAGSPGREIILGDHFDGDFFGELAALDGHSRLTAVRAVADSIIARMDAASFREAIHRYPAVCDIVLTQLIDKVRILTNRASEQTRLGVRERLCAELLRLSRKSGDGRIVVSPPPTHAELAGRISTHREAVTKFINALDREGLVSRTRGAIVLNDPERLHRIADQALA